MSELSDYQRGIQAGRVDALLEEHTARLNKINGSVERHAKSNETLAKEMKSGFDKLAVEMRVMQEEARARELAVKVAAETLASETERRRVELADSRDIPVRKWGILANKAALAGLALTVLTILLGIYFSTH